MPRGFFYLPDNQTLNGKNRAESRSTAGFCLSPSHLIPALIPAFENPSSVRCVVALFDCACPLVVLPDVAVRLLEQLFICVYRVHMHVLVDQFDSLGAKQMPDQLAVATRGLHRLVHLR